LGYHIGKCLIAMLDGKLDPKTMDVITPEDTQETLFREMNF